MLPADLSPELLEDFDDRPYRRLAAGLLLRAARDARDGCEEAAEWLPRRVEWWVAEDARRAGVQLQLS